MSTPPVLARVPEGVVTLADHESQARTRLDANAWAYFSGGAADELTLRANRSAWDHLHLLPRVLQPLAGGHTRVELLGRTLAHPILLAPVAHQKLAHPDGELATAHAAALALGASAVLLGRPYVYGLANAGAVGVAHVLRLLRDELEIAMALCGCRTLQEVTPALLAAPGLKAVNGATPGQEV